MFYVGLDVHLKTIVICVLDDGGRPVRRHLVRSTGELCEWLAELPPFQVCYEAAANYGTLHDRLAGLATRVVVAHPGHLRLIFRSRRKTDRLDAERLAKYLYLDEVPAVHVPTPRVRDWREAVNHRQRLVQKRTRVKNAIRALLRAIDVAVPRRPGLWTRGGRTWLAGLELEELRALKRDVLLEELDLLDRQVARVERALEAFSRDDVRVAQLRSIPGVGLRTAEAVVAFLDDPHRFKNAKQVGSYLGLVPSQDQSGETNRMGRITKQGPAVVRQLLVEAAWHAVRHSPTVRAFFDRVTRNDRDRRKKAIVATAHYLARVSWALLAHGTLWREDPRALAA